MEIFADIAAVYRRVGAFAQAMPAVVVLPVVVEVLRQGIAGLGTMPRYGPLVFTLLGTLAIMCVIVPALRWWRFQGDRERLWRLKPRVLLGVVAMLAIQLADEVLFTLGGHLLAEALGAPHPPFVLAAQLLWLFVSVPLFPWYVAMMSDDPLPLRQSVRAARSYWLYGFAVVLGSLLPVLALGILLRLGGGISGVPGHALTATASGALIAVLTLVTDSAYFSVYRMVRPSD